MGPWTSFIEGRDHVSGSSFIRVGPEAEAKDFIARARGDIPKLIAEIRRLRERGSVNYKRILLVWVIFTGANCLFRFALFAIPEPLKIGYSLSTALSVAFSAVLSWILIPKLFNDPDWNKSNIAAMRAAIYNDSQ